MSIDIEDAPPERLPDFPEGTTLAQRLNLLADAVEARANAQLDALCELRARAGREHPLLRGGRVADDFMLTRLGSLRHAVEALRTRANGQ